MHALEYSPLTVDVLPCWNLAALCAGLGPVRAVQPVPETPSPLPAGIPGEIRFDIPELGYRQSVRLGEGEKLVPAPGGKDLEDALRRVAGPMHLDLLVTVGEDEETVPITVRPPWYLAHDRVSRVVAAALVVPGDDRLLESTAAALFGSSKAAPIQPRHLLDREQQDKVPRRLYRHLLDSWRIQHRDQRRETDEWSDCSCQAVRSPAEVLRGDRGPVGEGNCLDLALVFAGCLETVGVQPLLFFTGAPDQAPEHVFVGWWAGPGPRSRPLLTDSEMLEESVTRGELRVLDPTGICLGPHRLEFDQAGARARQFFKEPVHAVDVAAARPPAGTVRSLVLGHEPIVQLAIWTAEALADRSAVHHRETTHLLYGLCAVEGELTISLTQHSGGNPGRLCDLIAGAAGKGTQRDPSQPTPNYRLCLEAARVNARARGSGMVGEADLLWAIIENPSRNVSTVLSAAGCDPIRFVEELRACTDRGADQSRAWRVTDL